MTIPEISDKPNLIELFQELQEVVKPIPTDFGGGSLLSKTLLMAYLFLEQDLKTYVEIGVYRGKSFFPMAYATRTKGGMAYGIDPYELEAAREFDVNEELRDSLDSFLSALDFSALYDEVIKNQENLGLVENSEIIKQTSRDAVIYFQENRIDIDMLYVDGNHDTRFVMEDINMYFPLVKDGGFIVMDDINWASVRPAYNQIKKQCQVIFESELFAILYKPILPDQKFSRSLKDRYKIINSLIDNVETFNALDENFFKNRFSSLPKISVIVTSYKHENYIGQCLEGIFAQKGDFTLELVIRDDGSPDSTLALINRYTEVFCHKNIELNIIPSGENIGVTMNLKQCLDACTGNYIAICEGDDYWIDSYKLQKQLNYLKMHPECSFCFNEIFILKEDTGELSAYVPNNLLGDDHPSTRDLVLEYFVGNMSCCMYDAKHLPKLSPQLFDLFIGDWMFNICYSEFGAIGHVKETLSVYRKHSDSAWASHDPANTAKRLYNYIYEYNRYLDYNYEAEFSFYQSLLYAGFPTAIQPEPYDVAIIDDVFPHPLSAFRMQEFMSHLNYFGNACIYTSGLSIRMLGKEPIGEIIANFKRLHPYFSEKVKPFYPYSNINARLLYFVFLGNAFTHMDLVDRLQIPFVFTLYPGGGFGLNNEWSDTMLKRVTSSPWFRKVIVTQKATYDYLLEKGFCTEDQIEFIFGVVMPLDRIPEEYPEKRRYGFEKQSLDIGFVAHKYTEKGIDKGYDVFVESAKVLCERYDNIHFHVVGGFDETVIDVTEIKDRITFYGNQQIEWFNEFYKNVDLILSPNQSSMIYNGSFDGFPTGCCVDAGLRKTAVLCTDELHLNNQFIDGEEIVIILHDTSEIVRIIDDLYHDPARLKEIGEKGVLAFKRIYSYESQVYSRINVLDVESKNADENKARILEEIKRIQELVDQTQLVSDKPILRSLIRLLIFFIHVFKRVCPKWMKRLFNDVINSLRANPVIYGIFSRSSALKRIYLRIRMTP